MKLSKTDLNQLARLMLSNGYDPKAQAVLAKAGGTPTSLDQGRTLLDRWTADEKQINVMAGRKQTAWQAEEAAYQAAAAEVGDLIETLYHYFNDNAAILSHLGLHRREYGGRPKGKSTNGDASPAQPPASEETPPAEETTPTNTTVSAPTTPLPTTTTAASDETTPPPDPQPKASTSDDKPKASHPTRADIIAVWGKLCANVQTLDPWALDLIAQQGWTLTRCAEAADLVAGAAQADRDQQAAISAYHTQIEQARQARQALYDWYWPIAKLARRAIRKLPPTQRTQYKILLGL